jgi:tetratricopeptide (TPR) repeat protein
MPGFEESYYRAFALVNSGDDQAAIRAFRALSARDPAAPVVRYQLGRELRKTKQYEAALGELTRALALAPDFSEAAFELGVLREDLGDAAGAEDWYRRAIAINPAYPEAHAALARRRFQAGDPSGAREAMARAMALAPSDPVYREAMRSLETRLRK